MSAAAALRERLQKRKRIAEDAMDATDASDAPADMSPAEAAPANGADPAAALWEQAVAAAAVDGTAGQAPVKQEVRRSGSPVAPGHACAGPAPAA
jgi:hypothetical protein